MLKPRLKFTPTVFAALLAILAPIGYIGGRFSSPISPDSYLGWVTADFISGCLGAMIGIPIGLFFGTIRSTSASEPSNQTTTQTASNLEVEILAGLKAELAENKALFDARKGSATVVARLGYVTTFWDTAKASGQLKQPRLMSVISLAYYWLSQANHLETLAYDAKNSGAVADSQFVTAKLISEVRLLDSSIESALSAAIDALSPTR